MVRGVGGAEEGKVLFLPDKQLPNSRSLTTQQIDVGTATERFVLGGGGFFRGSLADGGRWAHRGTVLCPLNDVRARLLAVHVWKNRSSVSPVSAN